MTPWRGLSGTNSGGRFASGRFCSLPNKIATSTHPAAKGVRQKEFGKKVTNKVTETSEKVTKK